MAAVTSGTIETSYYNSEGDKGRYVLDWEIKSTSGFVRTISYSVKVEYKGNRLRPYSCFLDLEGYNGGTVSTTQITILPKGSYPGGWENYPESGDVIAEGTFEVTHSKSNAKGGFKGTLHGGMYSFSSNAVTGTASFDLGTLYTNCSAPTRVWVDSTITAPGKNTTLKWSGASAGIGLSIKEYDVYRATSLDGDYKYIGSTTSTSYSVQSPTTRGSTYYYKVRSYASVQPYNSERSKDYGYVSANYLPEAPTASADRTSVPSIGATVKFTVSAGSDKDGQSCTLYYATSSTGTKTKFTSPLSQTISSASTYYFYTYDGLEYSSAKNISISLNTKPSISSVTENAISTYSALGGTGTSNYQKGYAYAIQPKITVNKTGTLKIAVEMENSNTTSSTTEYGYIYSLPDYSLTSISNVELYSYNIHEAVVKNFSEATRQSTNIKWRLKFILNDGYENSDAVYYPDNGYYYTIARAPTLTASYNQFADSNITGTNTGQVWRQVRMKFYNDASVTSVSVAATAGGIAVSPTSTTSVNGNYRYVDVTLPDNIAGSSAIVITASLTNISASITKKVTCNVTESPAPTMGSITHGASTIYPFTGTGTYQVSTVWPFGSYSALDSTTLRAYNCSTTASNAIKFVHASNMSGANQVVKTLTWAKSGDNLAATMDRATAYGWNHELGYSTYVGSQTYYCQLQITNLFGKTFTSGWLSRTFNFNELAQTPTISTVQWAQTNTASTSWTTFRTGASGDAIQESLYLRFGLNFGLFTEDKITVNLRLTNDAGTNTVLTQEFQASELSRATGRTAASNTVYLVYGPVNNISTSNNRKWTFQVTTTRGTATSTEITMRAQKQTAPTINFLVCSTTQDYDLTYQFTQTDTGGGTITNYLYGEGSNLSGALTDTSGTVHSLITGWDVKSICIKSVSTVTGLITRTVNYYSNYIIVYQLSPTVAYRKNQLGINTNAPTSGAIIDIHQSTGADSILLQGRDANNNTVKFDMNILNGTIKFYVNGTVKHTLDMVNGTLT